MEESEQPKEENVATTILTEQPNDPWLAIAEAVAKTSEKADFIELASVEVDSLGSSVGASSMCVQVRLLIRGVPFNPPAQLVVSGDYTAAVEAFQGVKLSASSVLKKAAEKSPNCSVIHDTILAIICKSISMNPKSLLTLPNDKPKQPLIVGVPALHVPNTKIRIYIASDDLTMLPRFPEVAPAKKGQVPPLPFKGVEIAALAKAVEDMQNELQEGQVLLYTADDGNSIDLNGIEGLVKVESVISANGLSALEVCNVLDSSTALLANLGNSIYEKDQYVPLSNMFVEAAYSSGGTLLLSDWSDPSAMQVDKKPMTIFPEGLKHVIQAADDVTDNQLRHFQAKLTEIDYPLAYDAVHISSVFEMISRGGFLVRGLLVALLSKPLTEGVGSAFQTTILAMFRFDSNKIIDHFCN